MDDSLVLPSSVNATPSGSGISPVLAAALSLQVLRWFRSIETRPSEKILEKRLAIYDDLAPLLGEVVCYFSFLGCWNELDPPQLIALKRKIDNRLLLATPFFSPAFLTVCQAFQDQCFETVPGSRLEARIKTYHHHREKFHHVVWREAWNECFSDQQADPAQVVQLHRNILDEFRKSLEPSE